MKHRSLPLLLCTALLPLFQSCGSSETQSSSATTGNDTTSQAATAPAPSSSNSIISTPTNLMVVRHEVADFDKWKTSYDAHDSLRLANGVRNYVIGRSMEDPNNVLVATKIDDVAKAKAFANNASLKEAMQKGGVKGKPTMNFVTMVWQDTGRVSSDIRSRTTFTVKDFDAWRKAFESQRQTRRDNGLAVRAFGYDMDNHNKVTIVMVVNDTAKAKAFWNSDQLKQLRAQSGVIGQPERFVYRVVQRY